MVPYLAGALYHSVPWSTEQLTHLFLCIDYTAVFSGFLAIIMAWVNGGGAIREGLGIVFLVDASIVFALRSLSVVRGSPNPQREQRTFHVTSMFCGNVAASILPLWAVLQAPGPTKSDGLLISAAAGLFRLVAREGEGEESMALAWILAVIGLVINPLFFF